MLDENDPLYLALMHAKMLVRKLENAESFRIIGEHGLAERELSEAQVDYHTLKISKYAKEVRDEPR